MLSAIARDTMNNRSMWSRLLARVGRRAARPSLRVQALGLSDVQIRQLRPLCARIGDALELLLEIDAQQGDIVLTDSNFARSTPPQRLARLVEARPLVTCDLAPPTDAAIGTLALFERRQRELLAQLRELPQVRSASRQFGASGWAPEAVEASFLPSGFEQAVAGLEAPAFSASQQRVVTWLLRGLMDPAIPPMWLSYGPEAVIRVDFAQSFALVDPQAQQALRVRRELPALANEGAPGADAIERELDELVWDIGIAFGQLRLLDQPTDWWHTPLATCSDPSVQRFTRLTRHLDLATELFRGRVSPAELQRRTGYSVAEMRPFLQACLFLGLAWWSPEF